MFYMLLYKLQRLVWKLFSLKSLGVKVIITNDNNILLVKPNHLDYFLIPGGNASKNEELMTTAKREIYEELGIQLQELKLFASYQSNAEGKDDTISLFTSRTLDKVPVDLQKSELQEWRYFDIAQAIDLPEVSPATKRRLKEVFRNATINSSW